MSALPWADLLFVLDKGYGIATYAPMPCGRGYLVRPGFAGGYRLWEISDNGGELNIVVVNHHPETYHALPLCAYGVALDAGTLAYRIAMTIKGEAIDPLVHCPDLVEELRELSAPPPAMPTERVA